MMKIVCPKCKWEYVPAEIFVVDKDFLGDTELVHRDEHGKLNDEAINIDNEEWYICDNCGTKFWVQMKVDFCVLKNKNTGENLDNG